MKDPLNLFCSSNITGATWRIIPQSPGRDSLVCIELTAENLWLDLSGVGLGGKLCHLVFLMWKPLTNRPFYLSQESSKPKIVKGKQGPSYRTSIGVG